MTEVPTHLHIYKGTNGICNNDKLVKGPDKLSILYYLSYTTQSRGWKAVLTAERKGGPTICRMAWTTNGDINVEYVAEEWRTRLVQRSHVPGQNHVYFQGPDGKEYHWKGVGTFSLSNDLKCFDSNNTLIATYTGRPLSLKKDGDLAINPPGVVMVPLLVATGLVLRIPGSYAIPTNPLYDR